VEVIGAPSERRSWARTLLIVCKSSQLPCHACIPTMHLAWRSPQIIVGLFDLAPPLDHTGR
jgi:hypothetical protein